MVVSVSFQKRVPPGAAGVGGRGTLAEMMAQQKAYADARSQAMAPETPTIMQGLGKVANVMAAAWGERRARNEEAAGREKLAQLRAGINLDTGATSEQIANAGLLDEDYANTLQEQAIEARRLAKERELKVMDRDEQRKYETGHEAEINQRELGESQAATAAQNAEAERARQEGYGHEAEVNTREGAEAAKVAEAQRAEAERIRLANQAGGQETIIDASDPRAKNLNLQPGERAKVSQDGTKVEVIKPEKVENYEAPTHEDIINFNLDPALAKGASFKMKIVNGIREPVQIGTAPQDSALSGEVGARLGLMNDYFKNFGSIMKDVEGGAISGANYLKTQANMPGRGTDILRIVQSGSEALVRNLTGAGMPESEARKYVTRYEPGAWSLLGPADAKAKLQKLYTDMWNVHDAVVQGHRYTDDPGVFKLDVENPNAPADANAAPADANAPPTEDDIQHTMQTHNMTREQVLAEIAKRGGQR
jgi:hypothetical protein